MGLLSALAWREHPRSYAGTEHAGNVAIVLEMPAEKTRYVFHTLAAALVEETPTDRFLRLYAPDLSLTAVEAAAQLRALIRTQLSRTSIETLHAVNKFIKHPPKDLRVARSSAPKRGPTPHVYLDAERRSCLVLSRERGTARLLRLRLAAQPSVELVELPDLEFSKRYAPQDGYPPEKLALIYVAMAAHVGASDAALTELAKLTKVSKTDRERAQQRYQLVEVEAAPKRPTPTTMVLNEEGRKKRIVNAKTLAVARGSSKELSVAEALAAYRERRADYNR